MKIKNQRGFTVLEVVLAIVVVLGIVGAAYYIGANKDKSQKANTATVESADDARLNATDDISNWKTYSDTLSQASFKYPSDWELKTESIQNAVDGALTVTVTSPGGQTGIMYQNYNAGRGSPVCPEDLPCPVVEITDITKLPEASELNYVEYIVNEKNEKEYNIGAGLLKADYVDRLSLGKKEQNQILYDMGVGDYGSSMLLMINGSISSTFTSSEAAKKFLAQKDTKIARKIMLSTQIR